MDSSWDGVRGKETGIPCVAGYGAGHGAGQRGFSVGRGHRARRWGRAAGISRGAGHGERCRAGQRGFLVGQETGRFYGENHGAKACPAPPWRGQKCGEFPPRLCVGRGISAPLATLDVYHETADGLELLRENRSVFFLVIDHPSVSMPKKGKEALRAAIQDIDESDRQLSKLFYGATTSSTSSARNLMDLAEAVGFEELQWRIKSITDGKIWFPYGVQQLHYSNIVIWVL
ncbi:hypothetical protein Sjap_010948 [Stephania japonica]|uniref:Uncharacterized protein n=1 Tax=Stephania japonica TaxID=461633 RepID=A0AAP0JAD1_9MAGN